MPADDIRVKLSFFNNIKTRRIVAIYGIEGAVSIIKLWIYSAQFAQKGDLTDFDEVEWKAATGRDSDCMAFVNDLYKPGMNFLDKDKKGRTLLHDWKEHQGFVFHSDVRSRIARKNIEKRWKSVKTKKKKDNTDRIPSVSESNTMGNSPSPLPLPLPLPSPKGRGQRASKPERISFEKAETAWKQFEKVLTSDNVRVVIKDDLSRKIFFDLGGKDRIMELLSQNGDRLKAEFVTRYSVLEVAQFRAAV